MAESIIKPDYRKAMKDREPDWLGLFKEKHAKADGKLDVDALFKLAEVNGADPQKLSNLRKQRTDASSYGARMSMTIGNMLRKIACQRHGLWGLNQKFYRADSEFLQKVRAPESPTHKRDGTLIEQRKAA